MDNIIVACYFLTHNVYSVFTVGWALWKDRDFNADDDIRRCVQLLYVC